MDLIKKTAGFFEKEKTKNSINRLTDIIFKYRLLLITFLIFVINPYTLIFCFKNYTLPSAYLWIAVSVASVGLCNIAFKSTIANKKMVVYFFVFLALVVRGGFADDFRKSCVAVLCLSFISIIVLIKREYMFIVPWLCLLCDFFVPQFVNEFLISLVVFYLLTKKEAQDISVPVVSRKEKVLYVCSVVVYLTAAIKDMCTLFDIADAKEMIWQYYNDYFHFGFVTRGLVATIRYIIMGPAASSERLALFVGIKNVIFLVMILGILLWLWRKSQGREYNRILIVAFLCSFSFRNIVDASMYVYFDSILVVCFLVCAIILTGEKYYFLIPVVTGIAMCIHHSYSVFLFPALFALMIYKYLSAKGKQKNKIAFTIAATLLIVCSMFIYFQYFSYRFNHMSFQDACEYLSACIGNDLPDGFANMTAKELLKSGGYFLVNIKYVIFGGMNSDYGIQQVSYSGLINSLILWVLMLPVVGLYFMIFRCYRLNAVRKSDQIIASVIPFSLFLSFLSFLEVDYGRWNSFLVMVVIISLLVAELIDTEASWLKCIPEEYKEVVCRGLVILMMIIPNMGRWATFV